MQVDALKQFIISQGISISVSLCLLCVEITLVTFTDWRCVFVQAPRAV